MLNPILDASIKMAGIKKEQVEDICIGNVLASGAAVATSRIAQYMAGFPHETSTYAINRLCSSDIQACANIAYAIESGEIDIGIGGGYESMSKNAMEGLIDVQSLSDEVSDHEIARNCLSPMGITAENVAVKYKIPKETMDKMAVESHRKANEAQKLGLSQKEITPIHTIFIDKDGNETKIVADRDDGVRPQTTMESLGKLKPAFVKGGIVTAGNSSQVTDGAAAVVLAKRSVAKKLGCKIYGRMISYATAGVPPEIMGVGPRYAIPKALKNAGLTIDDIDIFEVNEAFASQAWWCCTDQLKIPDHKLNPRGGAIALGHPLGMTGARMVVTLLHELHQAKKRFGVISMCIGTGMGAAGIIESEWMD